MFLSFLSFKNQKPDLSKLRSENIYKKDESPTVSQLHLQGVHFSSSHLILPSLAYAQNNQGNGLGINPGVPNGTYAFTNSGWLPAHPNQAPVVDGQVPLAGAGRITFIPTGTMNGLAFGNTSGVSGFTAGGQVFSVTFTGMFNVNADGSVSASITLTSINPPFTSADNLILYPSPDGNTIAFRGIDPGGTSNGVMTRH
jgi:hypothetical protein